MFDYSFHSKERHKIDKSHKYHIVKSESQSNGLNDSNEKCILHNRDHEKIKAIEILPRPRICSDSPA